MENIGIGALVLVAIVIVGAVVPIMRGRIAASRAAKRDPLPDLEADRVYRKYLDAEDRVEERGKTQMRILGWGLAFALAVAATGAFIMVLRTYLGQLPGGLPDQTLNQETMLWVQWVFFALAGAIGLAAVYVAMAWPNWVDAQRYFYKKSLTPAEFAAAQARFEAPLLEVVKKKRLPWKRTIRAEEGKP